MKFYNITFECSYFIWSHNCFPSFWKHKIDEAFILLNDPEVIQLQLQFPLMACKEQYQNTILTDVVIMNTNSFPAFPWSAGGMLHHFICHHYYTKTKREKKHNHLKIRNSRLCLSHLSFLCLLAETSWAEASYTLSQQSPAADSITVSFNLLIQDRNNMCVPH